MILRRIGRVVGMMLVMSFVSGCSTLYNSKWKQAGQETNPTVEVHRLWEGTWTSDVNQHQGRLRCIVSEPSAGQFDLHFWATWSVFAGAYHVSATVESTESGYAFSGEKNLGKLAGGIYRFEGTIEGEAFESRYMSNKDQGRFSLTRAPSE